MLSHLGYTQRTFFAETGGRFEHCIHPDDRAFVRETLESALREADEFELRYRMRRRDGEVCWMIERGRKDVPEAGRTPLILSLIHI